MRVKAQDAQNHGFGFRFRVWNAEQWIRIKGLAGQNAGLRVQGVGCGNVVWRKILAEQNQAKGFLLRVRNQVSVFRHWLSRATVESLVLGRQSLGAGFRVC